MITVNAGHRNVGKHMSDFGQRSLRRSKLEMSDLNTVTWSYPEWKEKKSKLDWKPDKPKLDLS